MRESKLYINFFRANFISILLFWSLFLIFGVLQEIDNPQRYLVKSLFEVNYSETKVVERVMVADSIVSQIRSETQQSVFDLKEGEQIKVYKDGPLNIVTEIEGEDINRVRMLDKRVGEYIAQKIVTNKVGARFERELTRINYLSILITSLVGLGLGSSVALFRSYLKHF